MKTTTTAAPAASLEFHPYAELFPLHDGARLDDLVADIGGNGLLDPITLYLDKILDGRRRYLACAKAGVEPRFEVFSGDDRAALSFACSKNLPRRHLSDTERAMIAAQIANMKRGFNHPVNPSVDGLSEKPVSAAQAAEMMDVSEISVERAKKVVKGGTPALKEAVKTGKLSLTDGAAVANEPANVQNQAVKDVQNGKAGTATEAVKKRNFATQDRAGNDWPAHILPAVEASRELNAFRLKIAALVEQAEAFSEGPMRTHIEWTPIIEALEKIRKACLNGKPDNLCPYCQGSGKAGERGTCRPCRGSGWVPAKIWDQSPAAHEVGAFSESE